MRECVIVGGGIHGTYLAQRLLADTRLEAADLTICDPHEKLLASFRQQAAACEMDAMRSSFVHHVGTEPFGLEDFAEATDREDELLPTKGYPPRPSLSLFLDYADYVIDGNGLEELHRQTHVESIHMRSDGVEETVVLETTTGVIEARTCVLAIGPGDRYRRPEWATEVDGISHVWDDGFDPGAVATETVVVGGGITAGQLACCLAERERVTVLSRHELTTAAIEAEPLWINWQHIESELHRHPAGSQARYEQVRAARNDGTIPPRLNERLETLAEGEMLTIRQGEVDTARTVGNEVRLLLTHNGCLTADRVVLATGFEPVFDHPFVDRVAADCDLARGYRGMPILADGTLAWERTDGQPAPIYVSGALAAGTVGPFAGNVAGARRAADRITDAIDRRRTSRSRRPV